MQKRLLEIDMLKVVRSMKTKNPSSLESNLLLDYHRKTHMLYQGNINRKPVNKDFINSIVALHDNLVREMLKRRMKHNTPLSKI